MEKGVREPVYCETMKAADDVLIMMAMGGWRVMMMVVKGDVLLMMGTLEE